MFVSLFSEVRPSTYFIFLHYSTKYVEFVVVTVGDALTKDGLFQAADYNWGLWITQLPCDGSRLLTAPTGCFQYFLESSGIIRSYNYQGDQNLNNQVGI